MTLITRRQQLFGLAAAISALAVEVRPAFAAATQVAVAANFTDPAREIAGLFRMATGHTATLSFGSSGQFYTQISRGAPYEVFLSADPDRPTKAEQDGLGVPKSRFTYAIGRIVLYSKTHGLVDPSGQVLKTGNFQHLAIADPDAAPYGAASVQTMRKMGVYDQLRSKIVMGTSIAQTYQFVDTGSAELGFLALSQVINIKGGSRWVVPSSNHAPINQQAILLYTGQANPAAKAFLDFLKTPAAIAVIRRYGYERP
ncbi:MAG: molybdate ABC transporter substrate-binding protein [Alphaproteobacteria bacterium]